MGKLIAAGIVAGGLVAGGAVGEVYYQATFATNPTTLSDVHDARHNLNESVAAYSDMASGNPCGEIALRGFTTLSTDEDPLTEERAKAGLDRMCGASEGNAKLAKLAMEGLPKVEDAQIVFDHVKTNYSLAPSRHGAIVILGLFGGAGVGTLGASIYSIKSKERRQQRLAHAAPTWASD